jgi:hypothetical protein
MKRLLPVRIVVLSALVLLAGTAFAQAPKKADVAGTWFGYAVVNEDGSGFDITMILEKAETGYTGKLSDASGAITETPLRAIVFSDNKLSCELDLPQAMGSLLIRIELILENESLKGAWFDPDGNSGGIELTLRK